jgi:hypothetical protein
MLDDPARERIIPLHVARHLAGALLHCGFSSGGASNRKWFTRVVVASAISDKAKEKELAAARKVLLTGSG